MIVFTGLSGLGQVEPRVRHDLRRGPAPLRRVAVGVRAAVPRPDGQARRRLHRGPVARGVDRPEVHVAQPALDRRHHHRGLRLPPAAVRPRRPAALPGVRRADLPADSAADRRPHPRARRGRPVPGARARHPRPQGRVRRPVPAAADPGLLPRPRRRRDLPTDRAAEAGQAEEAHDRGRHRPAGGEAVRQAAAHRLGRDRARPGQWPGRARLRRPAAKDPGRECASPSSWPAPTSTPIDIEELEPRSFSFNSPFGACTECHGLGTRMVVDPELVVPDPEQVDRRRRDLAVDGGPRRRLLQPAARGAGRRARLLARDAVGRAVDQGAGVRPRRPPDQLHVRYKNRYGRERVLLRPVRGRDPLHRAPARRGRERHQPRAVRGLHARGAVPGLRRRPAQADAAGRHGRRQEHRRDLRAADRRGGARSSPTTST